MRWFTILLISLLSFRSAAQEQTLCFEISHQELDIETSYLFGTMHAMEESRFFFPKKITKLLGKTDALCLEIKNISEVRIAPEMLFDTTLNLKAYCNSEEWLNLTIWAEEKLFMKPLQFQENFKHARPFMLFQFILAMNLPANKKSHEQELEKIAVSNKSQLLGLESANEQLNIFNQIPFDDQMNMVFSELTNREKNIQDFNDMQRAYRNQNLNVLCDFANNETLAGNKALFLDDRNKKWIPKMREMMTEKSTFFAVGAGHLCGKNGLISLLKKEGFKLKVIKL
jgi:hypothetical protein